MKKYIMILCAAVIAMTACTKVEQKANDPSNKNDYSEIYIDYSAMENLSNYITITFEVDGQTVMTVNKASDKFQKKITNLPASGTITCKAVLNENYNWNSEQIDFILNTNGHVGTVAKNGGWSSIQTLNLPGKMESQGIKADKVKDVYESKAKLLNKTFKYSIDANGSVTVE